MRKPRSIFQPDSQRTRAAFKPARLVSILRCSGRERRLSLNLEGFPDVGFGQRSLAENRPVVAIDPDNCRGESCASVTGIKDEWDAVAELPDDLLCVRARRKAREICARAGDRAANGINEVGRNGRIGPAERDAATIACDF